MNILFLHPNFPGQFKHLARFFGADKKHKVMFACKYDNKPDIPGVTKIVYKVDYKKNKNIDPFLLTLEEQLTYGKAMWKVADELKKINFKPDVIYAHPGWGEGLFLRDIFPKTPIMFYMEFYYRAFGADVHFSPDNKPTNNSVTAVRVKNANNLLNLEACDLAVTPTKWQMEGFPKEFQGKFRVIHEGINTEIIKPKPPTKLTLPNGISLNQNDYEIITYIARNFEPMRGSEVILKVIEKIQKERPKAHILMVGSDGVSYYKKLDKGQTYKQLELAKVKLDESRIHWLGKLPHDQMITMLQYSMAHIYLTWPFVLSWSMLEAMSCGCVVVGSDTAPVKEVLRDGKNGFLVDFYDIDAIAEKVGYVLDNQKNMKSIREAARQTILDNYDLRKTLPESVKLIENMAGKK